MLCGRAESVSALPTRLHSDRTVALRSLCYRAWEGRECNRRALRSRAGPFGPNAPPSLTPRPPLARPPADKRGLVQPALGSTPAALCRGRAGLQVQWGETGGGAKSRRFRAHAGSDRAGAELRRRDRGGDSDKLRRSSGEAPEQAPAKLRRVPPRPQSRMSKRCHCRRVGRGDGSAGSGPGPGPARGPERPVSPNAPPPTHPPLGTLEDFGGGAFFNRDGSGASQSRLLRPQRRRRAAESARETRALDSDETWDPKQ